MKIISTYCVCYNLQGPDSIHEIFIIMFSIQKQRKKILILICLNGEIWEVFSDHAW